MFEKVLDSGVIFNIDETVRLGSWNRTKLSAMHESEGMGGPGSGAVPGLLVTG
jgi:hypothetical protein